MKFWTLRFLLVSSLLLAGCTTSPATAPGKSSGTPGTADPSSALTTPSPLTTRENAPSNPTLSSQVVLPNLNYILDNTLYEESGNGSVTAIASLPRFGQILAACRVGDVLLVMSEKGIERLRLLDGRSERLHRFDQPAFFGDLTISPDGKRIYFDTVVDDPQAEFNLGSQVGMYDLQTDRLTPLASLPYNSSLLGETADGSGVYLLYHGQDTSLVKIFLLSTRSGQTIRELEIQGDSFAALAPDGDTLAALNLVMPTDPTDPTQLAKSRLYVYQLAQVPTAPPHQLDLLDTPLHLSGSLLWSADSRTIYVLLVTGNYWEDPTGFLPFGLWQLDATSGSLQQLSSVADAGISLESISADGQWLLLRGADQVFWVQAATGAQKAFDLPVNAFLVDGQ